MNFMHADILLDEWMKNPTTDYPPMAALTASSYSVRTLLVRVKNPDYQQALIGYLTFIHDVYREAGQQNDDGRYEYQIRVHTGDDNLLEQRLMLWHLMK